uniref:CSON012158 protein n=1 Tax=Culicoides sonorensis TaxID=179676 RepID=A0A336M4T3_CULSO
MTIEQQLLNVFEAVINTLELKLQRIDTLDQTVENMMHRVQALDDKVGDNIEKTINIIDKLKQLDIKLTENQILQSITSRGARITPPGPTPSSSSGATTNSLPGSPFQTINLDSRLVSLDQKVTDIDSKLIGLKNQIDNNFLTSDDINAEASERKPVSMNVAEITRSINTEMVNQFTKELDVLKSVTDNIDKKLQFHINLVSENLGKALRLVNEVHDAVVDPNYTQNQSTTTPRPYARSSKLDTLAQQIRPIMSVSDKMDEVWNVVVGTKSSVDHLVPKSDELLTQTQRQERAIGQIHQDLRTKTNLIIENLDLVERRLKKQEDDVAVLAQRPVPAELLLDPTIDRIVEYDKIRYSNGEELTETVPQTTTYPSPTYVPQVINITTTLPSITSTQTSNAIEGSSSSASIKISKKGGIIFPSVKNKPSVINNTFATDATAYKDIKGYSCVDLLNAGMRQSGVYYLQIRGTTYWFLKVFCEQEIADGGWTVIQRRDDFGEPRENFNRDWADYKNGFGDPAKEFWLGNENIYMLTNNEDYSLRLELEDFEGNKRYAQYAHFKIHSEADYYKLEIDGYEGNAGDSLNDPWYGSNNSPFSTYNRDNDRSSLNCASMLKGGWWWKSCGRGLNGLYLHDPQDLTARQGIVWFRWRGWDYTLKRATMMIKPKGLQTTNFS